MSLSAGMGCCISQTSGMNEREKEEFLEEFFCIRRERW